MAAELTEHHIKTACKSTKHADFFYKQQFQGTVIGSQQAILQSKL